MRRPQGRVVYPKLRVLRHVSRSSGLDKPHKNRCGQKQDVLTNPSVHLPGWQQLDFTRRASTRSLAGSENDSFTFSILLFYQHVWLHYKKTIVQFHQVLTTWLFFYSFSKHPFNPTNTFVDKWNKGRVVRNSRSQICARSLKSFRC